MAQITIRVNDDAVERLFVFLSFFPEAEVVEKGGGTKPKPTDRDIHEAARRSQNLMHGQASWAVIYMVLCRKFCEQRSMKQFERDMNAMAMDLKFSCPPNTISSKLGSSPWLREPIESWKSTDELSLAYQFEKALIDCIAI